MTDAGRVVPPATVTKGLGWSGRETPTGRRPAGPGMREDPSRRFGRVAVDARFRDLVVDRVRRTLNVESDPLTLNMCFIYLLDDERDYRFFSDVPGLSSLGRRRFDGWSGFQWTGAEPPGMSDPGQAEPLGAVWEGDELVTYDLEGLRHGYERAADPRVPDQD